MELQDSSIILRSRFYDNGLYSESKDYGYGTGLDLWNGYLNDGEQWEDDDFYYPYNQCVVFADPNRDMTYSEWLYASSPNQKSPIAVGLVFDNIFYEANQNKCIINSDYYTQSQLNLKSNNYYFILDSSNSFGDTYRISHIYHNKLNGKTSILSYEGTGVTGYKSLDLNAVYVTGKIINYDRSRSDNPILDESTFSIINESKSTTLCDNSTTRAQSTLYKLSESTSSYKILRRTTTALGMFAGDITTTYDYFSIWIYDYNLNEALSGKSVPYTINAYINGQPQAFNGNMSTSGTTLTINGRTYSNCRPLSSAVEVAWHNDIDVHFDASIYHSVAGRSYMYNDMYSHAGVEVDYTNKNILLFYNSSSGGNTTNTVRMYRFSPSANTSVDTSYGYTGYKVKLATSTNNVSSSQWYDLLNTDSSIKTEQFQVTLPTNSYYTVMPYNVDETKDYHWRVNTNINGTIAYDTSTTINGTRCTASNLVTITFSPKYNVTNILYNLYNSTANIYKCNDTTTYTGHYIAKFESAATVNIPSNAFYITGPNEYGITDVVESGSSMTNKTLHQNASAVRLNIQGAIPIFHIYTSEGAVITKYPNTIVTVYVDSVEIAKTTLETLKDYIELSTGYKYIKLEYILDFGTDSTVANGRVELGQIRDATNEISIKYAVE